MPFIKDHPLFGKVTDAELARLTGKTISAVCRARQRAGVSAAQSQKSGTYIWGDPDNEALLGVIPDYEIAKRLNCSQHSVWAARKRRGIQRVNLKNGKEPFRWKYYGKLLSVAEISELTGRSKGFVRSRVQDLPPESSVTKLINAPARNRGSKPKK